MPNRSVCSLFAPAEPSAFREAIEAAMRTSEGAPLSGTSASSTSSPSRARCGRSISAARNGAKSTFPEDVEAARALVGAGTRSRPQAVDCGRKEADDHVAGEADRPQTRRSRGSTSSSLASLSTSSPRLSTVLKKARAPSTLSAMTSATTLSWRKVGLRNVISCLSATHRCDATASDGATLRQ